MRHFTYFAICAKLLYLINHFYLDASFTYAISRMPLLPVLLSLDNSLRIIT